MRKRVLIVYYSFTGQSRLLVRSLMAGLEAEGVEAVLETLKPLEPFEMPFKSNVRLFQVMVRTFFRARSSIHPIGPRCFEEYDCIVLAGPTWSYHPSGPVLAFLDRYGADVCGGKKVLPLISCRSYWCLHYRSLKYTLKRYRAEVLQPLVFVHPGREPYRFIGLLLQLRGKMMRKRDSWFRKRYPGYGHDREQQEEARHQGHLLARQLIGKDGGKGWSPNQLPR